MSVALPRTPSGNMPEGSLCGVDSVTIEQWERTDLQPPGNVPGGSGQTSEIVAASVGVSVAYLLKEEAS